MSRQRQNAAAPQEFSGESQGCALAALGRVRLRMDAGDNGGALVMLKDPVGTRPGLCPLPRHSTYRRPCLRAFGCFLRAFLDGQNGAHAVDADLYESLSAALRGAPQPVDGLYADAKGAEIHGNAQAAETDHLDGRYGRCAAGLAAGIAKRSDRDLLLLAACTL